jgi:hypothetical protein
MAFEIKYLSFSNKLIISGVLIFFGFSILFIFKTGKIDLSEQINTQTFDAFGSLIGGIVGALFSLASILLLIHTIKEQEIDNQRQKIESRFFELLKIHRENYSEFVLMSKTGRVAIIWMLRELFLCYSIAKEVNKKVKTDYSEEDLINFTYLCFYFGSAEQNTTATLREYVKEFDDRLVDGFIKRSTEEREKYKNEGSYPHRLFSGHQLRLGHYFRHLFQTVNFIDKQPSSLLSYDDKYEYIKTLRAQLSTQEQVLFFFNSMSKLGYSWEKKYESAPNKQLITKYNLIKNIPKEYIATLDLANYYPLVDYENQPFPKGKEELLKQYH